MHTVILVDDEIFVRKGLRSLIDWNRLGYEVIDEAGNGEDALELIDKKKPDLVITDIRMPVLDGLELIGKSQEHNSTTSFIIITGYNDFSYAQQAVRYGIHDFILKPIDENELISALTRLDAKITQNKLLRNKGSDLLKEQIVENLIRGDFDESLAADWAKELRVGQVDKIYYAFIEINDIHPWNTPQFPSIEQMKEQIKLTVQQAGLVKAGEVFLKEHHGRFGFLFTGEQADLCAGGVGSYARMLQRALSKRMDAVIYVYVGKPVTGIASLRESYLSAKEALQYKYVQGENRVVTYSETQASSVHYIVVDDAFYRKLMEQIEEHNEGKILDQVEALFHDFRKKCFSPEAVKSAIRHAVNGVLALIRSMEGDERELASLEPIVSWQDQNVSPEELKRLFTHFLLESAAFIAGIRKDSAKGSIQKVKAYIEDHYNENISLKSIASVFYMNPVYLGQLFKKSYGMYFNDFLLQLRIGEAKKLLRQTENRIYEIAEKIGFSNADYFVTQFEKLERMTPTEYRNKLLEKK